MSWPPGAPEVSAPPPPPAGRLPWDGPGISPEPDKPRRPSRSVALLCAVALLASGAGAAGTYAALSGNSPQNPPVPASKVRVGTPETRLPGGVGAAQAVATALLPSIVKVATRSARVAGAGSGVIYTSDGYIITNNHVVQGATTVTVQLHTGEVVPARVVGSAAPLVDIAVLKIDKTGLKAAKFGSSRELKLGELAVAIGNPLGLEASVSAGVVSGLHRNGSVGRERFMDAVQTDAPLQPGNSGGALANSDAEVIGINTLVIGERNTGQGIGLAISSDTVINVADQIIESGSARLAFMGIHGEDAPGGGAVVLSLIAGGPADAAGLRPGDIVRSFDGARVTSMDGLVSALLQKSVGEVADLQIERDGSRRTVKVKLQARDE